ncbi:MAG: cardiolipin synthase [Defluviitaleaceae bacterium]|nr:cardiolipin synthase [Defluviitaleaceae bacterium]
MHLVALLLILVFVLNTGFMFIVIFAQRRNTAATWAWMVAIALLPLAGFVIYMIIGQDSRKQKVFLQKSDNDDELHTIYRELGLGADEDDTTEDNSITLYHSGKDKYEAILADIANAKKYIFVQYYILRGDDVGRHMVRKLALKAMEGVEVRLLLDGMGCAFTPRDTYQPLLEAGGKLGLFMPPVPVRINFRNHRKLAVIDNTVAYIGGSNIGKEYLGMGELGNWRDTHMRITGGAVNPILLRFIMDWNFASEDKMQVLPEYFASRDLRTPTHEGSRATIISSGPDTRYPNVLHAFCQMIMGAKKSIYIQTPYFVPDDALFTCIRIAALSGIDVRIMYPANPDHPFVYWASSSFIGELMCAGVKGYAYTKGFLHSKTVMVDSKICAVGTANMDVRSFKINFETHAFIEDETVTKELEAAFFKDVKDSRVLTLDGYNQRPRRIKVRESISRLFSPLL